MLGFYADQFQMGDWTRFFFNFRWVF